MISATVTVRERDNGWDKFVETLKKYDLNVTVGLHADAGSHGDGKTVVEIGVIHEFGTNRIPARSFIRAPFDKKRARLTRQMRKLVEKTVKTSGEFDAVDVLNQIGMIFKADVQLAMSNNIAPPLAESTVERKGSSVALIDTGKLRSSVDYQVNKR